MDENTDKSLKLNIDDNGRIYNFFRSHPGMLLTVISGIVAVVSFISRTIQYSNFSNFLQYWGWDGVNIEGSPNNISFTLAFSILNLTIILLADLATFKYVDPHIRVLYMIKRLRKDEEENESDVKERQEFLQKSGRFVSSQIRDIIVNTVLIFLLVWVLYVLDFALFYDNNLKLHVNLVTFLFAFIVELMPVVFCFIYSYNEVKRYKNIDIDMVRRKEKNILVILSDFISNSSDDSELKLMGNFSLRNLLSVKSVLSTLAVVILILFVSIVTSTLLVPDTADKRDFQIMTVDDKDYMVVYNSGTSYYLDQVNITDDRIQVDVNSHKIYSAYYGGELRSMHFENVERIGG